jgi:hypothetical protein
MGDDARTSFGERDERALLPSKTLESGSDPGSHGLIRAHAVSSFSPVSVVDDNDTRKAEKEPERTLHKVTLEADLENDATLPEYSDRPAKSSHRTYSRIVSDFEQPWAELKWIEVAVFVFGSVAILITFGTVLYLWLKSSVWRHDIAMGDEMVYLVTAHSIILRVAVVVQGLVLIFEFCSVLEAALSPRFHFYATLYLKFSAVDHRSL